MKTILVKILVAFSIISLYWINYIWNTYAVEPAPSTWTTTGSGISVTVTEKIPGANCTELKEDSKDPTKITWYECRVEKGFGSVTKMLWKIIKYFTYIAALAWVLYIVINGILYSMWWADDSFKTESKKRIITTLVWLIILMLSWVILNAIAPWIYTG